MDNPREHPSAIDRLLSGEARFVMVHRNGQMVVNRHGMNRLAILPGSFRPLHLGHEGLAQAAAAILGIAVVSEMSLVNVDKPRLEKSDLLLRLAQFQGKSDVVLTCAETFRKKAQLFPGCTFVTGWDTAIRLFEPKYYGNDEHAMLTAMADISAAGCRFLVAGRAQAGTFRTLAGANIPKRFLPLFQEISESQFRADISSTDLRKQQDA